MSYFRLDPGFRMPFGHRHHEQRRSTSSSAVAPSRSRRRLGGAWADGRAEVSPETTRAFEAGPGGVELLAFGAPNTENRDIEMAPGWWSEPRTGAPRRAADRSGREFLSRAVSRSGPLRHLIRQGHAGNRRRATGSPVPGEPRPRNRRAARSPRNEKRPRRSGAFRK